MTLSNRTLNRILLLLIGIASLAAGILLAWKRFPDATRWTGIPLDRWLTAVPDVTDPVVLWTTAVVLLVGILFAIAWIATRGRGRTPHAVVADGVLVDDTVVASILRGELNDAPDVLAVHAQGYRRYGGAVLVTIETRKRADLASLLTRIRAAIGAADTTIGTPVPLVVHLTTGIRTAVSGSRTTR